VVLPPRPAEELPVVLPEPGELIRLAPLMERLVATLPRELCGITDPLTGLPTRNLLHSPTGRAALAEQIPGPQMLALLDCQHAGAANRFGFGGALDRYFAALPGVVSRITAGRAEYRMLRLGGDEFALIVEESPAGHQLIRDLIPAIEETRARYLGHSEGALGRYVVERDMMRMIRGDYRKGAETRGEPISLEGFRGWMEQEFLTNPPIEALSSSELEHFLKTHGYDERCANLPADPDRPWIRAAIQTGLMQKFMAHVLADRAVRPAARFSLALVHLGEQPTWETLHRAEGHAARRIHASKDEVFVQAVAPLEEIDPAIVVKHDGVFGRDQYLARELRYREAWAQLEGAPPESPERAEGLWRIIRDAVMDPSLDGVLRSNLASDLPVAVALGLSGAPELTAIRLSFPGFGVLNNHLGYARADRCLTELVRAAAEIAPPRAIIRDGGGDLVLFATVPLPPGGAAVLEGACQAIIRHTLEENSGALNRIYLEVGERFALASSLESTPPSWPRLDFGECTIGLTRIQSGLGMSVGEALKLSRANAG